MTTVLQISLYGLVVLGSGMLAFAEGTGFPDAFTIPLAILALFVTERWKLFWLRVSWANLLGLAAFGLAGWELSSGKIEARLLSLAHLLVYLTWIVLFLSKTRRMYWNLCLLSVLHVAVGAVLTSTGIFGLMCGLFLVLAVWTLTLFTLNRARERYSADDSSPIAKHEGGGDGALHDSAKTFLWNQSSRPVSTVQIDPRLRWISGPFVSGVVANVLLSAVVGTLFFLFTPRIWVGNFSAFGEGPDQPLRVLQSGFAEEVQLGDIGQILEGTQTVLEVRMFDQVTEKPLDIMDYAQRLGFDEPLFRGSVLGEYEMGKWRVGMTGDRDNIANFMELPTTRDVTRQEFRVEPMDSGILFAMPQHVAGRLEHRSPQIIERRVTSTLYRNDSISGRQALKYTIYSNSEKPRTMGEQSFPKGTRFNPPHRQEIEYYRRLPERSLERLQTLARQVAQPAESTNATPSEKARRLVHHLRDSGEFGYTLDLSVKDSKIDAVEDFLFNRKEGHCEYFASALALMLRAIDIPARLVSGFKGGDLNPSTGYFVVQGRHAHVWVEAYLDNRWRVLDATPASRSDSVKSLAPKANLFNRLATLISDTWTHRVVGLSFSEQNTSLYKPLKDWTQDLWESVRENIDRALNGESTTEEGRFYVRYHLFGLLMIALVAIGSARLLVTRLLRDTHSYNGWLTWCLRLLNWLLPREYASKGDGWRARWSRWWTALLRRLIGKSAEQSLHVEFYERFLRLLRSAGLEPLPTQTPREFILATQPIWSQRLSAAGLTSLPEDIVSRFYRVRFGGESLPLDELRQLETQLREFEQHWQQKSGQG